METNPLIALTQVYMNPIFKGVLEIDPRELRANVKQMRLECTPLQWAKFDQDIRLNSNLTVQIEVKTVGSAAHLLQSQYQFERILTCSRTLKEFSYQQTGTVQIMVEPTANPTACELDDSEEDYFGIKYGIGLDSFSIAECIRQDIVLNEPLNPIANPEDEFNWRSTDDDSSDIDPRWAKLAALQTSKPSTTGD